MALLPTLPLTDQTPTRFVRPGLLSWVHAPGTPDPATPEPAVPDKAKEPPPASGDSSTK